MPYKALLRLKLSQIEAMTLKYAGTRLEESNWSGLTGYEMNALKRALDKLALGIADAQMRDVERGVKP